MVAFAVFAQGICPLLTRCPRTTSSGGMTNSALAAAMATTPTPAKPNERRKYCGKTRSAASAAATVEAENATVRPAVCTVRRTASSTLAPVASCSLNRLIINRP